MQKVADLFRFVLTCFLVSLCFFADMLSAAPLQQTSTGWLNNPNHPPVSVQVQLTGQSDPQLRTVNALLQVQLQGDWKTYWRSPGDGGAAPHFDFSQSGNVADVVWGWPVPSRYPVLGVETLGYKGNINFPLTLYLDDPAKPVFLKGVLTIASCTNICVLSDYEIELQFSSEHLLINDDAYFVYSQALGSVPIKLDRDAIRSKKTGSTITDFHTSWDNKKQMLLVQIDNKAGWRSPDVFVDSDTDAFHGVSFSEPDISISGSTMNAQITVSSWAGKLDLQGHFLNLTVVDKDLAVELLSVPEQQSNQGEPQNLLSIFIIALIGGFILNIMPCVLPVLGMKLSSVLSAEGINKRQQIRKQFIASSAGIVSSFWLLAAFLLLLKLSGEAVGWGIQFQSPYFIGFMVVITALFAANMLGIFTIQLPVKAQTWLASRGSQSYLGYYLQGMFATLLATPCSAPFLGTAVAFSLAASALQLFIVFTALGLGMALPWLLIALFPAVALCLPRPGKWMNSIRTFFALLILLTCYWLLSLLTSFIGLNLTLLTAFLLTALLLFLIVQKRGSKGLVIVFSTILMISAGWAMLSNFSTKPWAQGHSQLQWQPLQETVIDQQVQAGRVVFVDITADWCITCKANKIGVLLQEPVYTRLQEKDIITMRGDWTIPSKSITEYLQSYGRFGVPFNIVYGPDAPQGIPLPTLLTTESVLDAIEQAQKTGK